LQKYLVATIGRLIRKKNMMLTIFVKGKYTEAFAALLKISLENSCCEDFGDRLGRIRQRHMLLCYAEEEDIKQPLDNLPLAFACCSLRMLFFMSELSL
jgi:hypothetical protein